MIQQSHSTPGLISRENHNSKRYMHPNVHCSTIYNSQDMETTKKSFDRWMDKEDVRYIYIYIYTYIYIYIKWILLNHKKNETMSFAATWMDLQIIILNRVSQTEKEIPYDITYMWNLKKKKKYKWTYFQNRKILTDIGNKLTVTKRERGLGEGIN